MRLAEQVCDGSSQPSFVETELHLWRLYCTPRVMAFGPHAQECQCYGLGLLMDACMRRIYILSTIYRPTHVAAALARGTCFRRRDAQCICIAQTQTWNMRAEQSSNVTLTAQRLLLSLSLSSQSWANVGLQSDVQRRRRVLVHT